MAIISAVRPRQGRATPEELRSHNCRFKSTPILHRNSSLMNSAKSAREVGGNDLPDSSSLPIWDVWNARRGGKLARNGNTSSRWNLGGRKKNGTHRENRLTTVPRGHLSPLFSAVDRFSSVLFIHEYLNQCYLRRWERGASIWLQIM